MGRGRIPHRRGAPQNFRHQGEPTAVDLASEEVQVAVEILFGDGDKLSRDLAYAEAMERLAQRYPEDLEAASFHALAILGICHAGRETAAYMRAAAVVEEVFDKNPEHPGAVHYLIHSYDDPVHAPLGLRAARIYAEIAPAATHALHMPSHIFLALGMWDQTAASNVASWQASDAKVKRQGLAADRRSYHALYWLAYARGQQGRYKEARELLRIMEQDTRDSGSRRTRSHLALMRAAYFLETEQWQDLPPGPDLTDLGLSTAASALFVDGMAAVRRGQLEAAAEVLERMRQRRQEAVAKAAAGGDRGRYGTFDTTEAEVMELELEALLEHARGTSDAAVALLEKATQLEGALAFGFGPPTPPKPSHELYGEVLLELGRPAEARQQFEAALARAPRRARSLLGLARAAGAAGDEDRARRVAATLRQIHHRADPGVYPVAQESR